MKYWFIIYYVHDTVLNTVRDRVHRFCPRELWVGREAKYRSTKSKITRPQITNIELRIRSQILSDYEFTGRKDHWCGGS